jgi:hypothetical protein
LYCQGVIVSGFYREQAILILALDKVLLINYFYHNAETGAVKGQAASIRFNSGYRLRGQ